MVNRFNNINKRLNQYKQKDLILGVFDNISVMIVVTFSKSLMNFVTSGCIEYALPLEKIFMKIVQMTGGYKGLIWPHIQWILENTWLTVHVFYFINYFILLILKLVSNKIGTLLTSWWRHERHLSTIFRWILPTFRRFVKKLSTSAVVQQTNSITDY